MACRSMYEHERSLVQLYKNRPFALMGINTDSKDNVAAAIKKNELSWNSWLDGAPTGPISTAWHIRSYPTLVLIDAHGRVRDRAVQENVLDREIEFLVKEAEDENAKKVPASTPDSGKASDTSDSDRASSHTSNGNATKAPE